MYQFVRESSARTGEPRTCAVGSRFRCALPFPPMRLSAGTVNQSARAQKKRANGDRAPVHIRWKRPDWKIAGQSGELEPVRRVERHAEKAAAKWLWYSEIGMNTAQMRIVSLAPSATSILCAIGARKLLVGVTKWCGDVAPVGELPKLGDCWHLESIAEIARLRPDLVIGSVPFKTETVANLLHEPVNFLAMNPRTLADIERDILLLGSIAGKAVNAQRLVRKMRRDFAAIARKRWRGARLRVYCEAWPNPRISSPPWVAELVRIAGGEMTVRAGEKISDAEVAEAQPEAIVLAWAAAGAKSDPAQACAVAAWRGVPAVREGRIYAVRDELLNTPGPPLVAGARQLWELLHGEAPRYGAVKRTEELQERKPSRKPAEARTSGAPGQEKTERSTRGAAG